VTSSDLPTKNKHTHQLARASYPHGTSGDPLQPDNKIAKRLMSQWTTKSGVVTHRHKFRR